MAEAVDSNHSNICKYHHYGQCKFGQSCQNFHTQVTCENIPCFDPTCKSRHPKICRYFSSYGNCKFKDKCSYLHFSSESNLAIEIDSLREEVSSLKNKNQELEEEIQTIKKYLEFKENITIEYVLFFAPTLAKK